MISRLYLRSFSLAFELALLVLVTKIDGRVGFALKEHVKKEE